MKQSITAAEFAAVVEKFTPPAAAYAWDNSGYNLRCHDRVQKVLVALDLTMPLLAEAQAGGYDTILTHHPVLFHAQKQLWQAQPVDALVMQAIRQGCNVYCAHTSFDCAPQGMNWVLAQKFSLREVRPLQVEARGADGSPTAVLGSVGELAEPMTTADFARLVKRTLDAQDVRYTPGTGHVLRVALLGGAGGEAIYPAAEAGADALVTGEVKHNFFREAAQLGIAVCEAGHYDTEKVFRTHLRMCLQKEFFALQYNIKVEESEIEAAPYRAV